MLLIHSAKVCLFDRAAVVAFLRSSAVRLMRMPEASTFGFDLGIIIGFGFSLGMLGSWATVHWLRYYAGV
jgi:hypothetical protein